MPDMGDMDNVTRAKPKQKFAQAAKAQDDDDEGWGGAGDLLD
jgi:hypothetical protein